jgi:amino acid transporter
VLRIYLDPFNKKEKPGKKTMNFSLIPAVGLSMGLMLSPDMLVLLGNNVGIFGGYVFAVILLSAVVHASTANSYGQLYPRHFGVDSEAKNIHSAFGATAAVVLPMGSRLITGVFLSTGLLVTAGFVFNEVFLYWFPNFAFAFLLLGALLAVNLISRDISSKLQLVFIGVSFLGLLFLSIAGLQQLGDLQPITLEFSNNFSLRPIFLGLFIFVGFDLSVFADQHYPVHKRSSTPLFAPMMISILSAGFLFFLWSMASMGSTPLDKLAHSSIPFTVAARRILGNEGRLLMGIIVISGTCGAVNAFFIALPKMIAGMVARGLLPSILTWGKNRTAVPQLLFFATITIAMAAGIAGKPELELLIRAGLLFWLLHYAEVNITAMVIRKRDVDKLGKKPVLISMWMTVFSILILLTGFIGLLWTDSDSVFLASFMLATIVTIFLLNFIRQKVSLTGNQRIRTYLKKKIRVQGKARDGEKAEHTRSM